MLSRGLKRVVQRAAAHAPRMARGVRLSNACIRATGVSVADSLRSFSVAPSRSRLAEAEAFEFGAETSQLLDIVINSLYTDKEVFIRELVSNSSDALEKVRYMQRLGEEVHSNDAKLGVTITTDKDAKTITIEDSGVGLNKDEMVRTLGTIARSGSKEFLAGANADGKSADIIGQFGVGFYSAFMVAHKVEVVSTPAALGDDGKAQPSYKWTSEGVGSYNIEELGESDNARGTKIVMHLKEECEEFADPANVRGVLNKYSNFVPFQIDLNGEQVNTVQAIWAMEPSSVTEDQYNEFYKYIAGAWDEPQYKLHFRVDVPIDLKAVFFVGNMHSEKFGAARMDPGVNLYSKKVLIEGNSENLLPGWLRFVKGAVDSEDIPLQISREGIQDSALIKKIGNVLTRRILRLLKEESEKNPDQYKTFFEEFGHFLKEGAVTDFERRDDVSKLLRFETSSSLPGEVSSLDEYIGRMPVEQEKIYFLAAPTRELAMASPYYEEFQREKVEVLFLYDVIDEFVMSNVAEYQGRKFVSAETSGLELKTEGGRKTDEERKKDAATSEEETKIQAEMVDWMKTTLADTVMDVKVTTRLVDSPAIIVDHHSASIQKMMKNLGEKDTMSKQKLEINPNHPVTKGMFERRNDDPALAKLVAEQLFDNAMVAAGILDDPRSMIPRVNDLLEKVVRKN
eukprot:g1770.t1